MGIIYNNTGTITLYFTVQAVQRIDRLEMTSRQPQE